jgi:hypothetical protein
MGRGWVGGRKAFEGFQTLKAAERRIPDGMQRGERIRYFKIFRKDF